MPKLPTSLTRLLAAYAYAIEECVDERSYDNGYWIYLKDGWWSPEMDCQTIHEFTVKDLKDKLKGIESKNK